MLMMTTSVVVVVVAISGLIDVTSLYHFHQQLTCHLDHELGAPSQTSSSKC